MEAEQLTTPECQSSPDLPQEDTPQPEKSHKEKEEEPQEKIEHSSTDRSQVEKQNQVLEAEVINSAQYKSSPDLPQEEPPQPENTPEEKKEPGGILKSPETQNSGQITGTSSQLDSPEGQSDPEFLKSDVITEKKFLSQSELISEENYFEDRNQTISEAVLKGSSQESRFSPGPPDIGTARDSLPMTSSPTRGEIQEKLVTIETPPPSQWDPGELKLLCEAMEENSNLSPLPPEGEPAHQQKRSHLALKLLSARLNPSCHLGRSKTTQAQKLSKIPG